MRIDIDHLSYTELVDLNSRVVARLRMMEQLRAHEAMLTFSVGERVEFSGKMGETVSGIISKYNRKTVSVISDEGVTWRVSPQLLQRSSPAPKDEKSIVDSKARRRKPRR